MSGQALRSYNGKEVKVYSTTAATLSLTSISSSRSFVDLLANIPQSLDTYSGRVGRRIKVLNVKIKGLWLGGQTNSALDDSYNSVRTTVLIASSGFAPGAHGTFDYIDTRSATYQGVIRVLSDVNTLIRVSAKDSTGYIAAAEPFEQVIPVNEVFEYGSGGSAAPYKYSLYLLLVSDSVGVAHPGFEDLTRIVVEYVDMA